MNRICIRSASLLITLILAGLVIAPIASASESEIDAASQRAIDWLLDRQADDGGFPGFDGESDPGATADAVVALAAAESAFGSSIDEIDAALAYLEAEVDAYSESQGGAAKLVLAFSAAEADPYDVDGVDLVNLLQSRSDADSGAFDAQVFIHATAVLAIIAAGEAPTDGAIEFLVERQIEDGSWTFSGETEPGMGDTNSTAMAIQALDASGQADHDAVAAGLAYLEEAQLDDGSVVYAIGAEDPPMGDSNSTALTIQAMLAGGIDVADERVQNAFQALIEFQNESGALGYREDMPDDNALSTSQGLPALLGIPLPVGVTDGVDVELESVEEPDEAEQSQPLDPEVCDYFDITGHNLCRGFNDFWWENGGLAVFGYPLSEEFDGANASGDDVVVQYFERARFEYEADAPAGERISLTPLGADVIDNLEQTAILDPVGPCEIPDGADHAVCAEFLDYWNDFGGEAIFGLPLTEPFGFNGMTVQIFEYARFEHQPDEWPERYDVLLGRIGAEVYAEQTS